MLTVDATFLSLVLHVIRLLKCDEKGVSARQKFAHLMPHIISITDQIPHPSTVAQWKRAGLITRRSSDRNGAVLDLFFCFFSFTLFGM
jgi:hypothetical protein